MDLVVVIMNVFPTLVKRDTSECGRHESLALPGYQSAFPRGLTAHTRVVPVLS
jgi:hypothetical protein